MRPLKRSTMPLILGVLGRINRCSMPSAWHSRSNSWLPLDSRLRNIKVVDIVHTLQRYNAQVDIYGPWINVTEARREYGLQCLADMPAPGQYAAIILAVGHEQFVQLGETGIQVLGQAGAVLFDVKSILPLGSTDGRL